MGVLARTPFGKYAQGIKNSPSGLFNWRVLMTVCMYALAGMPKGWDEGTTASVTQLESFQNDFGISPDSNPEEISNLVSFVNLTAGVGALASFFLNDRIGRLWSLRLNMLLFSAGVLIETFSNGSVGALYAGRLVAGWGVGAATVVGPMAIVEIAPKATRGLMTLWFNICMLSSQMLGIFVVFAANVHINPAKRLQYQLPFFVQLFVPAICLVLSLFLYDSPRWLYIRGRKDEALATLTSLRGIGDDHPELLAEWEQLSRQSDHEEAVSGELGYWGIVRETFTKRNNLRRVQITIVAYLLAQFSGANSVTNYLPEIFGIVGVEDTNVKVYASGLYAFAKLFFCVMASLLFVEVVGRRHSLLIGVAVQAFCHSYLAGYLKSFTANEDSVSTGASDMAIAAIYIHAFGWAIGLYTLPYLFGAELWPNRIRSFGGALSQGFHWLFYFGITKATPSLLSSMAVWGAFVFFVAWCFVAFLYGIFCIPETAGLPLESIDLLFDRPVWKMRQSAREARDAQAMLADPEIGERVREKSGGVLQTEHVEKGRR